jgi:hypothetical protein
VLIGCKHAGTKEAKLLIEEGRKVQPGSKDFHEYLLRIGHPCADSADPRRHQPAAAGQPEAFKECMQDLAAQHNPTAPSNSSSSSSSSQLPLSIDATPIYLALPQAAAALKSISKDTKVILLLRHPVDRAQSLYNHRVATEANKHLPQRVMNHTISEVRVRGGGPLSGHCDRARRHGEAAAPPCSCAVASICTKQQPVTCAVTSSNYSVG